MTTQLPNQPSSRIEIIDALRGFTLLGIIIAHITEQYYAGQMPEKITSSGVNNVFDQIVSGIVGILISGKFFMIFSFLFGLSFFIQMKSSTGNSSFLLRFAWRLILLFIIGMVHHIHYRGDILSIYAMLGFGLLLTYRLPEKYILWLGLFLVFDIPGMATRITSLFIGHKDTFIQTEQVELMQYFETFKNGSYADLIKANLESFKDKMDYQVWSGRIYITMGLFLLGFYAGQWKLFEDLPAKIPQLKKYMIFAAWTLLGVFIGGLVFFGVGNGMMGGLPQDINVSAFLCLADIFNACLSMIYLVWFILLFEKEKWRNRLMHFYAAGRMGLTTYLMQTVFGVIIFSTLGFKMVGEIGTAILFVLAIVLFIFQMWMGKVWLKYFYYGPVEWIWRCLTKLKLEPLMR